MKIAITGGYVVPVDGRPVNRGTILISDGKIVAVGAEQDVAVPADAEVVDAGGRWVLPGFIDAHTHIGIAEEGEGPTGNDLNEESLANGARLRAIDGINHADLGFTDALSGGITTVVVLPGSDSPIGGQTVAVKCQGRTIDEMVLRQPVSVKSALGEASKLGDGGAFPATRLGVAAVLRDAFEATRAYLDRRAEAADEHKPFAPDATFETLARVLDGELPWSQHVHRADDIATAIRLADEFGYRLVINHGTEAHLIAELIAERDIPVITGPLFSSRSRVELRNRTLRGPGILARAGVRIAISTDHRVVPVHLLVHQVIVAVKEGLDPETGIRSITVNPAEILGLDDRVGALKPGLDGDVVIWSGDPLDAMSRALRVFIGGREVYRYGADQFAAMNAASSPTNLHHASIER